ncbi:MAG: HAMP domain-containing sensor histidine kinase [Sulfurospirillum sp.]
MFKLGRKKGINQINMYAIFFAGIFAFVAAFVVIFNEYLDFNKEISKFEKSYMDSQKKKIIAKTDKLRKIIEYNQKRYKKRSFLDSNIVDMSRSILLNSDDGIDFFLFDKINDKLYCSKNDNFNSKIGDKIRSSKNSNYLFFDFAYKEKRYLVYSRVFEDLNIIYGSIIAINDLNDKLRAKRVEYKKKISGFVLKIVFLTLVLYIISILKYRFFTEKISKELKYITNSLTDTSLVYRHIELNKIEFKEFNQIALHVNKMMDKIKTKNRELISLNLDLEKLVQEKTDELQKSIEYTKELLKYQDKFVKNAIHEINTPLSIILMNIELYNLKYEKNSYLTKIEAGVKVLENINGDLGYIVKKDRLIYKKEMIDFSAYLKERVEYFDDVAKGNDLELKSDIQGGIFVYFSSTQLQRLCDNNLSNAIKYSYPHETVWVKLFIQNNSVVFEISNKGDEIKESDRLFDRFYREDMARGGFGLGLNIVKEICDINYITINVVSSEGVTTFRYVFNGELY